MSRPTPKVPALVWQERVGGELVWRFRQTDEQIINARSSSRIRSLFAWIFLIVVSAITIVVILLEIREGQFRLVTIPAGIAFVLAIIIVILAIRSGRTARRIHKLRFPDD